jgi:hypothetical protein
MPSPSAPQYLKIVAVAAFVAGCCFAQWWLDRSKPPAVRIPVAWLAGLGRSR